MNTDFILCSIAIISMLAVEWNYRKTDFVFSDIVKKSIYKRALILILITLGIYFFAGKALRFIYFQF